MSLSEKDRNKRTQDYFKSLEEWYEDCRILANTCQIGSDVPFFPATPAQLFPPSFFLPTTPLAESDNIPDTNTPRGGGIFKIPPLWKRLVAEVIDFFILFFLKLALTFIATDYFEFIDIDKYDSVFTLKKDEMDFSVALEITREIVFLELIHRLIVCVYEGYSLSQRSLEMIGGATPGKMFMGLRVIACREVTFVPGSDSVVHVTPATTLTIFPAFLRAVLKNVALIAFTVVFPLLFNRHNRASYDIFCGSIVVEDTPGTNNQLRGR